jgi:CBS domain-containing protein
MDSVSIKDLMWKDPFMISPDATVKDAAVRMADIGSGILPVGLSGKVEGVITDRDIVVRAVSEGKDVATISVRECMTPFVHSCSENDTLHYAADIMKRHKISRLVITDAQGKLTGILSAGHIVRNDASAENLAEIMAIAHDPASNGIYAAKKRDTRGQYMPV